MLKTPTVGAEPVAVSCVDDTKVVASGVVPNRTWAPEMNLVPDTVSEKLPVPTLAGFVPTSVGVGFMSVTAVEALADVDAALVALTVTVFGFGSDAGAL